MEHNYDFIAIGDITTDAFIRLADPSAHIDIDRGTREICMRFADKIPYEEVYVVPAVGNSANAAVSAARLGLKSALVTNLGGDYFGTECLEGLKKDNVSTEFVAVHKDSKTNYHYVLWFDSDRTILIKHEKFTYNLPDINNPRWVYLSSVGEGTEEFHAKVEKYLIQHPGIKLAFQPGTFQIRMGAKAFAGLYKRTDIVICNKEESQRILETKEADIGKLLLAMSELGPKTVVITDGPKGAYAFDGKQAWFMRAYPDIAQPFERTGAGDAFTSTLVVALAYGLELTEALRWAPINSMSVVQSVGAQKGLLTRPEIEAYLAKAPKDYFPVPLER